MKLSAKLISNLQLQLIKEKAGISNVYRILRDENGDKLVSLLRYIARRAAEQQSDMYVSVKLSNSGTAVRVLIVASDYRSIARSVDYYIAISFKKDARIYTAYISVRSYILYEELGVLIEGFVRGQNEEALRELVSRLVYIAM